MRSGCARSRGPVRPHGPDRCWLLWSRLHRDRVAYRHLIYLPLTRVRPASVAGARTRASRGGQSGAGGPQRMDRSYTRRGNDEVLDALAADLPWAVFSKGVQEVSVVGHVP